MIRDSFSKRQYRLSIIKVLLIIAPPAIIAILLLWSSSLDLLHAEIPSSLFAGFIFGCLYIPLIKLIGKIFEYIFNKLFGRRMDFLSKEMFRYKMGYEGEEIVSSWVSQIHGDWIAIPNIECFDEEGGRFFDIDLVLVGKKGIFIIEVKNYSNNLEFTEDECFVIFPDGSKKLTMKDPRIQVLRNAHYVDGILNRNGIALKSRKVVASARKGSVFFNGRTGIYIADSKESLEKYLSLDTAYDLNDEEIKRVVEVLK